MYVVIYSGTSDKGPSEIGTTSLQGTKLLAPKCPLFGGSTVLIQNLGKFLSHLGIGSRGGVKKRRRL